MREETRRWALTGGFFLLMTPQFTGQGMLSNFLPGSFDFKRWNRSEP
jgi:hypothetical protein